jgi:hypothetical protein
LWGKTDKPKKGSGKVSVATVKLLEAAVGIAGSKRALARRLGITETLLEKFLADLHHLPDPLLLSAVDLILEDRLSRQAADQPTDVLARQARQ